MWKPHSIRLTRVTAKCLHNMLKHILHKAAKGGKLWCFYSWNETCKPYIYKMIWKARKQLCSNKILKRGFLLWTCRVPPTTWERRSYTERNTWESLHTLPNVYCEELMGNERQWKVRAHEKKPLFFFLFFFFTDTKSPFWELVCLV